MHKSGQKDFMVFMSSVIIHLRNMERMGTLHVYQSTQNRIADFMGDRSLSFEEINPLWLQAFQAYLLGRGLSWNTISTYMRVIRAVYYRAVDEGEAPFQPRLFRGVYTGTRVNVKRALSERTLRSLQTPHILFAGSGLHPLPVSAAFLCCGGFLSLISPTCAVAT